MMNNIIQQGTPSHRSRKRRRTQIAAAGATAAMLLSTVGASTGGYLVHPGSRNFIAYNSSSIIPSAEHPEFLLPEEEPTPQNLNAGQRCGVTDGQERDYNSPKSRADTLLPLNIQDVYVSGSEIEVIVNTFGLDGGGHFEFHLCALEYPDEPTEECFQQHPLEFVRDHYYSASKDELNPERAYLPFQQAFEQYGNDMVRVESEEEQGMGTTGFGAMMEFKYTLKLPDNKDLWTDVITSSEADVSDVTTFSVEMPLDDIGSLLDNNDGGILPGMTQLSDEGGKNETAYDGKIQISGMTGSKAVLISAMVTDGMGKTTIVSIDSEPIVHENGPSVEPVAICTFGDADIYGEGIMKIPDEIKKICGAALVEQYNSNSAEDSYHNETDSDTAEDVATADATTDTSYPRTKYALLRWHYQTARDCFPQGYDTYSWPEEWGPWQPQWGGECDGDESQDEYWNCAEVLILSPHSEPDDVVEVVDVPNEPPMAIKDIFSIGTNEEVQFDVLSNDIDPDEGDSLHVESLTSPMHGIVGISQDGLGVIYIPNKDYVGLDSFEYNACDKRNLCDVARVDIQVGPTMQFVFAMDDEAETTGTEPVYINVLENDIVRVNNWPLFVVGAPRGGRHGTCTVTSDNWILYEANPGYEGRDRCSYKACITSEICDIGVVYINVLSSIVQQTADIAPTNKPTTILYSIIAVNDGAITGIDRPIKIPVLANDEFTGNAKPRITNSTGANNGYCQVLDNEVLYTPNFGFAGWDRCRYSVCIGNDVCDDGLVKIKVFGEVVPEAEAMTASLNPVVNPDDAVVISGSVVTIDVLDNDEHPGGEALKIFSASSPIHGSVEVVNNLIRYNSRVGFTGTDSFKYSACDEANRCDSAGVVVTITAEVLAEDDSVTTVSVPVLVDVTANDRSSSGGDSLIVTNVNDGNHGSCSITASNKVKYTPAAGFTGYDRCAYFVCDGSVCDQGTVTVHVLPAEETPPPSPSEIIQEASVQIDVLEKVYAQDDHVATFIDEPIKVDVTHNDFVKGMDALTIMHTGGSEHGKCEVTDDHVLYTPNPRFLGTDTCGYIVCHTNNMCDEGILTIEVIDDLPPSSTTRLRSGIASKSYNDGTGIFLPPSADAYITAEFPDGNFGDEKMLFVSSASSSAGLRDTMLKFHTSSIDETVCRYGIESATLSIYSLAYAADGGTLVATSSKMWAEMEVTWNSAPVGDGIVIADLGTVEVNRWYNIDVSSAVTMGDPLSLRIKSHEGGDSIALYASRDYDDKSFHPVLKVKCLV
jgi:hypothetical protein